MSLCHGTIWTAAKTIGLESLCHQGVWKHETPLFFSAYLIRASYPLLLIGIGDFDKGDKQDNWKVSIQSMTRNDHRVCVTGGSLPSTF